MRGRIPSLLIFFLIFICAAASAEISIDLTTDRTQATLSDSVRVLVQVSGIRNTETKPILRGMENFSVHQKGTSSRVEIINGQVTAGIDYIYYIEPRKAGMHQIGPAEITLDGKTYQSQTLTLSVLKPLESGKFEEKSLFLRADLSKKEVYTAEQVVYAVKLYRRSAVRDISISLPENDRVVFKQLGKPREFQSVFNGLSYQVLEVAYALTPSKPGLYLFGPARMSMTVLAPSDRSRRSLFDHPLLGDSFFSLSTGRPGTVESNGLELNVLPLPETDRPTDFSGLVGKFTMESRLEPIVVSTGESATLTVTVSGLGNVNQIPNMKFPDLTGIKFYADQPKLDVTQSVRGLEGTKTMKWALVPETTGKRTLPPLTLSFFDPETGRYRSLETVPPALTARPQKDAEPAPPLIFEGRDATAPEKEAIKALGRDILPIHTSVEDILTPGAFIPQPWQLSIFMLVPPAVFLSLLCIARIRKKSLQTAVSTRSRKALKRFIRAYRRKNTAADRVSAVRNYINDRCTLCLGAVTSQELFDILKQKGVDPEIRDDLYRAIQTLESAVYGGNTTASADDGHDLLRIIRKLDRELK
jgi:hypothetical protein